MTQSDYEVTQHGRIDPKDGEQEYLIFTTL